MSGPKQSNGLRIMRAPNMRRGGVWDALDNEDPRACIILPEGHEKRVNFEESKLWIRDCISTHTECKTPARTALIDLRVLDCHNRVIVAAPKDCAYVALSYVWGKHTAEDTPQFPRLPDKLPRTVEDSIEATIRLGYRYLWIDRHCIDQNDGAAQRHQINQMGNIYSGAQVTIIATAGADANYGLPGVTCDYKNPLSYSQLEHDSSGHFRRRIVESVLKSVWYTRGWTYQEGYLSRRRMYFTHYCVLYLCDNYRQNEEDFHAIFASLRNTATTPDLWDMEQMMYDYTGRHLTNDHDALNAIIGALEAQNADHIWGVNIAIEDSSTFFFLHWTHSSPATRRKEFPSWSPIGWCGQVHYRDGRPSLSHTCSVEVWLDGSHAAISQNVGKLRLQHYMHGADNSKFLKLTTLVVKLEFIQLERRPAGLYVKVPYSPTLDVFILPFWDNNQAIKPASVDGRIELPCVVVLEPDHRMFMEQDIRFEEQLQIMILRQYGDHYERIGCFTWNDDRSVHGFAQDKQGCMHPRSRLRSPEHGDGRYWLRHGVMTTFLLG